ncbi:hypothetical protein JYT20_00235 [Rhodothermus sp. AH-315-K08]|nr:hypothetical protein [Rhodothermus sp. AH-315-K08]
MSLHSTGDGTRRASKKLLIGRRQSILIQVARGRTDEEIAKMESLAAVTVRNHVLKMVAGLQLTGRPHLVAWAWENGYGPSRTRQ